MIKHGQYHVSLATGNSRLFLSRSDPHLILYKQPNDMLRTEKGDKCVTPGVDYGLYLYGKLSI